MLSTSRLNYYRPNTSGRTFQILNLSLNADMKTIAKFVARFGTTFVRIGVFQPECWDGFEGELEVKR